MLKKGLIFICFFLASSLLFASFSVDVDFGLAATVGDDDLYLRIQSHYFDRDFGSVGAAAKRLKDPDHELPIVLFLAYHSGKDPEQIVRMRKSGLSYWEVSLKLGIPASVYFMDLPFDPGPPYGKAYGHWKKHKVRRTHRVVLTEREMYDCISLQIVNGYYGIPPREAVQMMNEGKDLKVILTGEYRKRHHPPKHFKEKPKTMKKQHDHEIGRRQDKQ